MTEKKLVVFDLDGTLNKTELHSIPAHQRALAQRSIYSKTEADIIKTFGERFEDCFHFLLDSKDPALGASYIKDVSEYEYETIPAYGKAFDGTAETLSRLKNVGYTLGVCSNASVKYITTVLKAIGLIELIDVIQPLLPDMTKDDTLKLLLQKEAPQKAVMVGDRIFDKNAAQANKIPFIGCLYGFCPKEVSDADMTVTSVSEIYDAVIKLID